MNRQLLAKRRRYFFRRVLEVFSGPYRPMEITTTRQRYPAMCAETDGFDRGGYTVTRVEGYYGYGHEEGWSRGGFIAEWIEYENGLGPQVSVECWSDGSDCDGPLSSVSEYVWLPKENGSQRRMVATRNSWPYEIWHRHRRKGKFEQVHYRQRDVFAERMGY